MSKSEKTSPPVASKASHVLQDPSASKIAKTIAASVLAQSGTNKVTSPRVATLASGAMRDGRTSSTTKTLAASGLTQKPKSK